VRGERDFEEYVAARGATVVRGLARLGLDLALAEEIAATSFAALRSDWHELQQSADPDVVLWATVLAVEVRRRRRGQHPPLDPAAVARVLRETAALEELRVCDVLGVSVPVLRGLMASPSDDAAPEPDDADRLMGPGLPYARVKSVVSRQRRRRWGLTAGVAVAAALAIGAGVALSLPEPVQRPGDALPAVPATREVNAAGVVWWADGELHLPRSVVRVADVRRLVAAGDGAAYVDSEGRLIGVSADGDRTLLGRPAEGSPLVSSPRLALVAWADASVPDVTRLVVWDVEEQREVNAVVTRPGVRPITFDGGWLRFGQSLSDWAWDPGGGPAQLTGDGSSADFDQRTALVDAVAGTRLEQWGFNLRVVRSGRPGETTVPGFGGSLSPDGRLVLTGPDRGREPRLYDARSGERLDAWGPAWSVQAAVFQGADEVTWLVEQDGERALLTCGPVAGDACSDFVVLGDVDRVLLAGDSRR
jgi:hypothetical protein